MESNQPNIPQFKARLTCDFKAVRAGQLSVTILKVKNGYATCQITANNSEVGQVPAYFLEMLECPGDTFADQIRYRRLWHIMVDSEKPSTSTDLQHCSGLNNADVFIRELGQVPLLAGFAQILPNLGPLVNFCFLAFFLSTTFF
uniref:Uncharacterized protein n=1 Tax=Ditylenchus dipsaci TaxID=166011 RepID=A0A915E9W9_9BILA